MLPQKECIDSASTSDGETHYQVRPMDDAICSWESEASAWDVSREEEEEEEVVVVEEEKQGSTTDPKAQWRVHFYARATRAVPSDPTANGVPYRIADQDGRDEPRVCMHGCARSTSSACSLYSSVCVCCTSYVAHIS
jgi:hypothetical protein